MRQSKNAGPDLVTVFIYVVSFAAGLLAATLVALIRLPS